MNAIRPGLAGVAAVLVLTASSMIATAGQMYARSLAQLSATDQGGSLGTITPGTPVSVSALATSATHAAIAIDGWSMHDAATVVYAGVGQRIVLANLNERAVAHEKVLGHKRDAYGAQWDHVRIAASIDPKQLTADVSTVWTAAHAIYAARCSACHALHQPTEFTANQWPSILSTMTKNAALDAAQAALVTKYLQIHARAQ